MVRNTKGGKQTKRMGRKYLNTPTTKALRYRLEEGEKYAIILNIYGGGNCLVLCDDGVERLCVIRKKFKGRGKRDNLLSINVWVLIGVRDWEVIAAGKKPKCDLLCVYSDTEKERIIKDYGSEVKCLVDATGEGNVEDDLGFVFEDDDNVSNYVIEQPTTKVNLNVEKNISIDDL